MAWNSGRAAQNTHAYWFNFVLSLAYVVRLAGLLRCCDSHSMRVAHCDRFHNMYSEQPHCQRIFDSRIMESEWVLHWRRICDVIARAKDRESEWVSECMYVIVCNFCTKGVVFHNCIWQCYSFAVSPYPQPCIFIRCIPRTLLHINYAWTLMTSHQLSLWRFFSSVPQFFGDVFDFCLYVLWTKQRKNNDRMHWNFELTFFEFPFCSSLWCVCVVCCVMKHKFLTEILCVGTTKRCIDTQS